MKKTISEYELSRPLQIDRVPRGGMREKIVAKPEERKALAERLGLMDLIRLEATLDIDHAEGHMFVVRGKLFADVVQQCVISLEPVEAHIIDDIDILFASPEIIKKDWDGSFTDIGDAEPPEPIENGLIDLGELVTQHLSITLDPYPRKEGATIPQAEFTGSGKAVAESQNPFAKLAQAQKEKGE